MPKPRSRDNKKLPKYWRKKHNSYMYRVPQHMRHLHGGKAEISLGTSLSEAYRKFASLYSADDNLVTMKQLFERYRFEVVSQETNATRKYKEDALSRLEPGLGHNHVIAMTPVLIYKYLSKVAEKYSEKRANQDHECLSHCFTKAIKWGVIADHPMTNKKVEKYPTEARDRYVEDWELREWARVAVPWMVAYMVLKGVTGQRKKDLLLLKRPKASEQELVVKVHKTSKKGISYVRYPLYDSDGNPTTVKQALDFIEDTYDEMNAKRKVPIVSPWLFYVTRGKNKGGCMYDIDNSTSSTFDSAWQRDMKKALEQTTLQSSFTDQDMRAKVGSDVDSDFEAQILLAHTNAQTTKKHYRRRGSRVQPGQGFDLFD